MHFSPLSMQPLPRAESHRVALNGSSTATTISAIVVSAAVRVSR